MERTAFNSERASRLTVLYDAMRENSYDLSVVSG